MDMTEAATSLHIGVRRVDFVAIPVRDLARAASFYGETLGLKRNPNSGERWVEFEIGGVTLALASPAALGPDFQPRAHQMPIALRVDDVEDARRKLEKAGVEFGGETIDSGVCRMANFADPDGNALQLHRRYAHYLDGSTP
jgi:predicted enzyme related to lactoylglutathione lyase